jgi:hypothetical protein
MTRVAVPVVDVCDSNSRLLVFHKHACVAACLTDYELFQKVSVLCR